MKKLILALVLSTFLVGCTTLQNVSDNSSARLTVQYATLKYVDEDTEKAERITEIVTTVKTNLTESTEYTIKEAVVQIRDRIDFPKLDVADQLLLDALLNELEAELVRRFGTGVVDSEAKESLVTVADWILDALKFVR